MCPFLDPGIDRFTLCKAIVQFSATSIPFPSRLTKTLDYLASPILAQRRRLSAGSDLSVRCLYVHCWCQPSSTDFSFGNMPVVELDITPFVQNPTCETCGCPAYRSHIMNGRMIVQNKRIAARAPKRGKNSHYCNASVQKAVAAYPWHKLCACVPGTAHWPKVTDQSAFASSYWSVCLQYSRSSNSIPLRQSNNFNPCAYSRSFSGGLRLPSFHTCRTFLSHKCGLMLQVPRTRPAERPPEQDHSRAQSALNRARHND